MGVHKPNPAHREKRRQYSRREITRILGLTGLGAFTISFLNACSYLISRISPTPTRFSATPSKAAPPPPPSATPTQIEPTPVPVTLTELGINDPALSAAFGGIEKTITQEAGGSFTFNKVASYTGENKNTSSITLNNLSFSNHQEIKNAYSPDTVDGVDSQGNKVTLIWDSENSVWRIPYNFENNISFMPAGDQKIVVESALLYFKDHPPFDDQAVQNYRNLGGDSLLFQEFNIDGVGPGKEAYLKAKGNDNAKLTEAQETMKFTGMGVYGYINGVRYLMPIVVNLDPSDPKNPDPNEFKVLIGTTGATITDGETNEQMVAQLNSITQSPNGLLFPQAILYGDANFQQKFPVLAQLLALPGNDPRQLDVFNSNIDSRMAELNPDNLTSETPLSGNGYFFQLDPKIQTMILYFSEGLTKQ